LKLQGKSEEEIDKEIKKLNSPGNEIGNISARGNNPVETN